MPHVVVKIATGRTEEQKKRLAEAITRDLIDIAGASDDAVSVAIEETPMKDWAEKVYRPEIAPVLDKLYKKPGYRY